MSPEKWGGFKLVSSWFHSGFKEALEEAREPTIELQSKFAVNISLTRLRYVADPVLMDTVVVLSLGRSVGALLWETTLKGIL